VMIGAIDTDDDNHVDENKADRHNWWLIHLTQCDVGPDQQSPTSTPAPKWHLDLSTRLATNRPRDWPRSTNQQTTTTRRQRRLQSRELSVSNYTTVALLLTNTKRKTVYSYVEHGPPYNAKYH